MSRPDSEATPPLQEMDPLFSIGSVARITELSEATLRVWERRYGFPRPARSAGRHRLYSQQAVIQLQWVKLRIDEGMQAHRAIDALQQTPRATAVATTLQMALPPPTKAQDVGLAALQQQLYATLLAYDGAGAARLIEEAASRYPMATVILEMIRPTLSSIGDAWHAGQTDVTTEHFATNFLRHALVDIMRTSPSAYQVSPVVLACAPGELHEGSLLILGALLRQSRWPVVYLGQTLPLSDVPMLVQMVEPALIVFVAMSDETALALADWPHWLPHQAANRSVHLPLIGYGGRAFTETPSLVGRTPGTLLGWTLDEGFARIHRLLLSLNAIGE